MNKWSEIVNATEYLLRTGFINSIYICVCVCRRICAKMEFTFLININNNSHFEMCKFQSQCNGALGELVCVLKSFASPCDTDWVSNSDFICHAFAVAPTLTRHFEYLMQFLTCSHFHHMTKSIKMYFAVILCHRRWCHYDFILYVNIYVCRFFLLLLFECNG